MLPPLGAWPWAWPWPCCPPVPLLLPLELWALPWVKEPSTLVTFSVRAPTAFATPCCAATFATSEDFRV